jgi:hypothetical protein
MKLSIQIVLGILLSYPATSQAQTVSIEVILTPAQPRPVEIPISSAPSNTASFSPLAPISIPIMNTGALGSGLCGGLGDPLQSSIRRFQALTEARNQATSSQEQARLERDIIEQGLKLPQLVTEDLSARSDQLTAEQECDSLLSSVTLFMQQVADYMGALQDARQSALW